MTKQEFLALMREQREAMYDYMEGCDAEEFKKYNELFCAYCTIVGYLEKEAPEHER